MPRLSVNTYISSHRPFYNLLDLWYSVFFLTDTLLIMGTTEYKLLLRTSTACTALSSKGDGRGEKRLGVCVGDSENYSLWIKVVKCPNGKWRACKTCGSLNPDDSPPLDDSITEPRLPVSAPAE